MLDGLNLLLNRYVWERPEFVVHFGRAMKDKLFLLLALEGLSESDLILSPILEGMCEIDLNFLFNLEGLSKIYLNMLLTLGFVRQSSTYCSL